MESVRRRAPYRCVATSIPGFVKQIAVQYFRFGYWFWVAGHVPEAKDPLAVDRKLIEKYGVDCSKWERARRKRAGIANCHYVRHDDFFVLLATKGNGRFFEDERPRDARKSPVRYGGYALSFRGGHAHVRIELEQYRTLKGYLLELSTRRSAEQLERVFATLPFEPYAPVKTQILNLLRAVNRERKAAQLPVVPFDSTWFRPRPVKVFE